jgi:peptidoglycan/LPS O-acetylase OafA/YrhL
MAFACFARPRDLSRSTRQGRREALISVQSPDTTAATRYGSFAPQRLQSAAAASTWFDRGSVPALDGMRAVSVLLVMAAHSGLQNLVPGGFGVTMFFFISGFLITTLMLRETREDGRVNVAAFYARRVVRLYPPLLAYLLVVVAVRWLLLSERVDPIGLAGALFYGGNYLVALAPDRIESLGSHLWSLAVEEHFYLFYPLVFVWLQRSGRPLALLMALCALALAARVAYVLVGVPASYVMVATETRFDSILYGALLAFASARPELRRRLSDCAGPATLASGAALLVGSLLIRDPLFRETARYSVQGVALLAIFTALLFAPGRSVIVQALDSRAARWIGALSYSLYLWHGAAFVAAHYALDGRAPAGAVVALGWIAAFVTAWGAYTMIEKPLFALRRRLGSHARSVA